MLLGIDALGELALGDAPPAAFIVPVFPRTAGDIIVSNAAGNTLDVTRETVLSGTKPRFDPDQLFNYGAVLVLDVGFDMSNAPNPLCILIITKPNGTTFLAQSPYVYIGMPNLPTYIGVLAGATYVCYTFDPGVLTPGRWQVQLAFAPTPQTIQKLSFVGEFFIP